MAPSLQIALFSLLVAAFFSVPSAATSATVTDGDALYAALIVPGGGSIVIATDNLVLTRGLSINQNYIVECASGFECVIDISAIGYTDAIIIHGGASVTLQGLTIDGKGAARSFPAIYATGRNSNLALYSVTVQNCNNVAPNTLGGGIEIDRNVKLSVYGASSFIGNTAAYGPAIGAKMNSQVRICFATFSGNTGVKKASDLYVKGNADVQACYGGQDASTAPVEYTNVTGYYKAFQASSSASCPLLECGAHPQSTFT